MKTWLKENWFKLGIFVLAMVVVFIWSMRQIDINWNALKYNEIECKKTIAKDLLDPNQYMSDLYGGSGLFIGDKIRLISVLSGKSYRDIENMAKDEWYHLANKAGWEQMNPPKVSDLIGTNIDWDSIDWSKQDLSLCKKPDFIKFR